MGAEADVSMIATIISDINYVGMNGKKTDLAENVTLEYVVNVSTSYL